MNNLEIFKNEEFGTIRTKEENGKVWFVAKDICEALDIKNAIQAVQQLEEDEVCKTYTIDSLGRKQETNIINESGLYALIIRSNKPNAKKFRKWVTSEVLPAIRKDGGYIAGENQMNENGEFDSRMQTKWTQKGRLFIYELLKKNLIIPMMEREEE